MRARFAQAEWLAAELLQVQSTHGYASHPLIARWLAGELRAAELTLFAAEHHHAVLALELAARRAAALSEGLQREQLERYARERSELIALSCEFAAGTGWGRSAWYFAEDPLATTADCARALGCQGRSLARHLVTIHALESSFGELAPLQHDALALHYGFAGPALAYFAACAERSEANAGLALAALTSLLPLLSPGTLVRQAELAHRSYLELLDGVEQLCATQ
jgi:pyrroloquinoline quinone (PQQ) biosynthesis protein C